MDNLQRERPENLPWICVSKWLDYLYQIYIRFIGEDLHDEFASFEELTEWLKQQGLLCSNCEYRDVCKVGPLHNFMILHSINGGLGIPSGLVRPLQSKTVKEL